MNGHHPQHDIFIRAIHDRAKLSVTFYSKEDRRELTRTCAPMDYAPGARIGDGIHRYWFWDFDSDTQEHTLGLLDDSIVNIEPLQATFAPADFVTWIPNWAIQRDWGAYS